jgi:hypothetical protein
MMAHPTSDVNLRITAPADEPMSQVELTFGAK